MRHFFSYATMILVALFLYSCTRELESPIPSTKPEENLQEVILTAAMESQPQTRTSLHSDGKVYWSPGDKISLFYGSGANGGSPFTSQNTQDERTAQFKGQIDVITIGGEGASLDNATFWGVYPYREDNECDGSTITTTLPDVQTAKAGTFDDNLFISMGNSTALNIAFYNVCSGIMFTVSHPNIERIEFSGNNNEILAGRVKVGYGSDGKPEVKEYIEPKTTITVVAPNDGTGTFQVGQTYYLVMLPVEFSASMKMTFILRDGNTAIRRWSAQSIKFSRNKFKDFTSPSIDDDQYATFMETVDLGLPSGTLWATCNLGAITPEASGNYYSWGELTPRPNGYSSQNATIVEKYQDPARTEIELEDDAAYYLLGGDWRVPTQTQMEELISECTWSLETINGVGVWYVEGPNGNGIHIPKAGFMLGTAVSSVNAFLWTSTKNSEANGQGVFLRVNSDGSRDISKTWFYIGTPIRPVRPKTYITNHQFVEMGDGLKWATCNVGADNPWDYGNYYAWGDITPKSSYTLDNYFDKLYLLYAPDKTTRLMVTNDAARCNWGGNWRMPTYLEWDELNNSLHYTWTWTDNYIGTGVKGMIVVSRVEGYQGNSIFLPAAGYKYGEEGSVGYGGKRGYYWSSDLWSSSESAEDLYFYYVSSSSVYTGYDDRYKGFSVRPVCD